MVLSSDRTEARFYTLITPRPAGKQERQWAAIRDTFKIIRIRELYWPVIRGNL